MVFSNYKILFALLISAAIAGYSSFTLAMAHPLSTFVDTHDREIIITRLCRGDLEGKDTLKKIESLCIKSLNQLLSQDDNKELLLWAKFGSLVIHAFFKIFKEEIIKALCSEDAIVLLATHQQALIGFMLVVNKDKEMSKPWLIVDPAYTSSGIEETLTKAMIQAAMTLNLDTQAL